MPAKRKPKRLPQIPAWEEVDRLLRATDRKRDRLILMLGAFLALRVSEITKLQAEHLDLSGGILNVRAGKGQVDRAVPIPDFLHGPLRGWLAGRTTGPVFPSRQGGGPLTTRAVRYMLKRVAVKAGLPDALKARKYFPHSLRHAAASRWLQGGASIAEVRDLLGHSSVAVTDRYTHSNPTRFAGVVNMK